MLKNNIKPKNTRIRIKSGQLVDETDETIGGEISLPNLGSTQRSPRTELDKSCTGQEIDWKKRSFRTNVFKAVKKNQKRSRSKLRSSDPYPTNRFLLKTLKSKELEVT